MWIGQYVRYSCGCLYFPNTVDNTVEFLFQVHPKDQVMNLMWIGQYVLCSCSCQYFIDTVPITVEPLFQDHSENQIMNLMWIGQYVVYPCGCLYFTDTVNIKTTLRIKSWIWCESYNMCSIPVASCISQTLLISHRDLSLKATLRIKWKRDGLGH